jgi:hypothetical protein
MGLRLVPFPTGTTLNSTIKLILLFLQKNTVLKAAEGAKNF